MTSQYSAQEALTGLIRTISNDALAASYQSIGGYREALLKSASDYLARTGKPAADAKGHLALFLGGPKNEQLIDLAELHSTFVDFEHGAPRFHWDPRTPAKADESTTRVVYQLHRYPGDRRAFYVDTRIDNPASLIKRYL